MDTNMKHQVFWYTQGHKPSSSLERDISADVVIVGGGMAGLSAAQRCAELGLECVLVEREFCGAGASGKTSGFITPDSELELTHLVENYGAEKAKKLWEFVTAGVGQIRKTIEDNNFNCDYQVQDSLFIANTPGRFRFVEAEHRSRLSLGYQSTLYARDELEAVIGSDGYHGAVRYPDTFGMNSFRYCKALKRDLQGRSIKIYENTPVQKIESGRVTAANGKIVRAKYVLICADRFTPKLDIARQDVYGVQTFLGVTNALSEAEARRLFPEKKMMVWDSDLIYQYFRLMEGNRLLIGAASMFYTYLPREIKHSYLVEQKMLNYLGRK